MGRFFLFNEHRMYIIAVLAAIFILLPEDAFAYIDPGIGGMVFQVGYAVVTAFILSIKLWLKLIKRLFKKQ